MKEQERTPTSETIPEQYVEDLAKNIEASPQVSSADRPVLGLREKSAKEKLRREAIRDRKADRKLRKRYAGKAFWLVCSILGLWGIVVVTVGIWSGLTGGKVQPLADKVLIVITAGATANVFAAFLGVIRGLFPLSSNETKKRRKNKL